MTPHLIFRIESQPRKMERLKPEASRTVRFIAIPAEGNPGVARAASKFQEQWPDERAVKIEEWNFEHNIRLLVDRRTA